jgi:hypothetical protein
MLRPDRRFTAFTRKLLTTHDSCSWGFSYSTNTHAVQSLVSLC